VVQRATRPVRSSACSCRRARRRPEPHAAADAPRELLPLIDATNQVMQRCWHLLRHQKRFVRDASHQLRTPLAVLKTQVQSALRGDVPPRAGAAEISDTVDRATQLANQMLALAKVEQLRQQGDAPVRWTGPTGGARRGAGPVAADRPAAARLRHRHRAGAGARPRMDAARADAQPAAQRHAPRPARQRSGGRCDLRCAAHQAALTISDSGPGIDAELAQRLFQPFSAGDVRSGSGLGLAICHEIVLNRRKPYAN
jgi:two-component system sensor histidine kinase TctE